MATDVNFKIRVKLSNWSDEQKREVASLNRRATAFAGRGKPIAFDKDGNVADPVWAKILDDLEAWADKYKVKLTTSERELGEQPPHPGATPIILGDCPSRTTGYDVLEVAGTNQVIKTKYTCYLKRRGLFDRCVYRCWSEQV